jgi:hypothetical protein
MMIQQREQEQEQEPEQRLSPAPQEDLAIPMDCLE